MLERYSGKFNIPVHRTESQKFLADNFLSLALELYASTSVDLLDPDTKPDALIRYKKLLSAENKNLKKSIDKIAKKRIREYALYFSIGVMVNSGKSGTLTDDYIRLISDNRHSEDLLCYAQFVI